MLFNKTPTLKDTVIIGVVALTLLISNMYTLRAGHVTRYAGLGLYYAILMLYRHFTLLKHDGKNGPLENADERSTSISHEAGYRTLRFTLGFTFVAAWVPSTYIMPGPTLAVLIVGMSVTVYTLLELDLRLDALQEGGIEPKEE